MAELTAQYVHRVPSGSPAPSGAGTRISGDLGASAALFDDAEVVRGNTYDYYVEAVFGEVGTTFSDSTTLYIPFIPPTVEISQPVANSLVSEGMMVTMSASATEGSGEIESREWVSDVDGVLGDQDILSAILSGTDEDPVSHVITYTVTDSNGEEGSASVVVTVGAGEGSGGTGFDIASFVINALGGLR